MQCKRFAWWVVHLIFEPSTNSYQGEIFRPAFDDVLGLSERIIAAVGLAEIYPLFVLFDALQQSLDLARCLFDFAENEESGVTIEREVHELIFKRDRHPMSCRESRQSNKLG